MSDDSVTAGYDDSWLVGTAGEDEEYVGSLRRGGTAVATFYDARERRLVEREFDHETERVTDTLAERDIEAGESLGRLLGEIGEETGWDSLSEFAREHFDFES
jgi:hypothetical protein